jgi:hypothetical protein
MNAIEGENEVEMGGAEAAQVVPGDGNSTAPEEKSDDTLAKYRDENGELDAAAVMAALKQSEERLEGLRKKLADKEKTQAGARAEPAKPTEKANLIDGETSDNGEDKDSASDIQKPSLEEEMKEELAAIGDESDREFAEKFIGLLGRGGLTKEKAGELLSGLGELYQPEDPKKFFQEEMKKLGKDGKEIVGRVRMFRDEMVKTKEFDDSDIAALEQVTQTADGVRLLDKVLEKARAMDGGKFSHARAGDFSADSFSNADRIRLYEKAFAIRRTRPEESEAEVARLDRMFTK